MEISDYEAFDRALATGEEVFDRDTVQAYVAGLQSHPLYPEMARVKTISMLHTDALMLLRAGVIASKGMVLEMGPYIGGSTIAISMGLSQCPQRTLVTVEMGGAFDHAQLPTADIIADWRKNVDAFGFGKYPKLLKGWTNSPHVLAEVHEIAKTEPIGLIFIDADGDVERDMICYADDLSRDCILVFDDYALENDVPEKSMPTKRFVDEQVRTGRFEPLAAVGWYDGTWFGRLKGKA